jgi:hypothetical protein
MSFNSLTLILDLAGDVAFRVLIILTLYVDVRANLLDSANRIRRPIDCDPVDALQRGKHFSPKALKKCGPRRTLVDESVGCHGNDKDIAKGAGGFQMAHMAEMQQVKSTMCLYDNFARLPQSLGDGPEFFECTNLIARVGRNPRARL